MSTPRLAVALAAALCASTASIWPSVHAPGPKKQGSSTSDRATADLAPAPNPRAKAPVTDAPWPPPGIERAAEGTAVDVTARLELTSSGAHRLVIEKTGAFVHLRYREVTSAGPDWASIELRAGERAPKDDVAIWEHTDPQTLVTTRGLVKFALRAGATPELSAALSPRLGARDNSAVRTCQSFDDGESGFAVVCRISPSTSSVRAIRPISPRPLAGAWVWEEPVVFVTPAVAKPDPVAGMQVSPTRPAPAPKPVRVAPKPPLLGSHFVRLDLPLSPGGAEIGALAYTHGAKGFVIRADATWPSAGETPTLLFTETGRVQPQGSSFWR